MNAGCKLPDVLAAQSELGQHLTLIINGAVALSRTTKVCVGPVEQRRRNFATSHTRLPVPVLTP